MIWRYMPNLKWLFWLCTFFPLTCWLCKLITPRAICCFHIISSLLHGFYVPLLWNKSFLIWSPDCLIDSSLFFWWGLITLSTSQMCIFGGMKEHTKRKSNFNDSCGGVIAVPMCTRGCICIGQLIPSSQWRARMDRKWMVDACHSYHAHTGCWQVLYEVLFYFFTTYHFFSLLPWSKDMWNCGVKL